MGNFEKGKRVAVLDDNEKGKVLAVDGDKIKVLLENGFEIDFSKNELCLCEDLNIDHVPSAYETEKRELKKKVSKKTKVKRTHQDGVCEIDLHIEKLCDDFYGMSNFEMLRLQEDCFVQKLEDLIKYNKTKKHNYHTLVAIHGVGEGVLKERIRKIVRENYELHFSDGSYTKYRYGATEIYLDSNIKR